MGSELLRIAEGFSIVAEGLRGLAKAEGGTKTAEKETRKTQKAQPSVSEKAQQEQKKGFYQEILDKLKGLPADTPDWREALKNVIGDIIQSGEQSSVKI